ncbi:VOC family protein [Enterococcus faecium]|uniref:VOC family protein n=1 Tax=Enterococcus faecium TaxID=1352 RepID=UPI00207461B0|nr:VOC family protein [Enterococcus faecium]MCM6922220.1 VOC family protein [Enterococcus faecium]
MKTVILAEKPSQAKAYAETFQQRKRHEGYYEISDPLITNARLNIYDTLVMFADTPEGIGPELVVGNNVSLVIQTRNEEETKRLFESLAEGGKIEMPLDAVPWAQLYGMVTDRFGINWQINQE